MNIKCEITEVLIDALKERVVTDLFESFESFDERRYFKVQSILEDLNYGNLVITSSRLIYDFLLNEVPYDVLKAAEDGEHLAEDILK